MAELIGIALLTIIVFAITWRIVKPYTDKRCDEAERKIRQGYVVVGWDFIQGPILVPPEAIYPPDMAKRIRAECAREHTPKEQGNG